MNKHLSLAFFLGLLFSCAKPDAAQHDTPLSIAATDSLSVSSTSEKNTSPSVDRKELPNSTPRKTNEVTPTRHSGRLQGKWVHDNDSLAYVEISGSSWVMGYEGQESTQEDTYTYTLLDKLPQFFSPEVKADFIVLTNKADTLYYELNGVTEETLSLTWYPAMKVHVYKRKN
jgi:hypothetical protein